MFKKFKEKIAEEVKISPQRFQQLTQSVSEKLQSSSTSEEKFFSIGDDDNGVLNTSPESEFTNVSLMSPQQENHTRRNSNSSLASDVSFLPRYESYTNIYHLQSDLEVSASEIEDNGSSSSQLEHLSKQQIYCAFQKSQLRYHKYRGRYTDLARHYKDLERENQKMKSVLVDTQDKAFRRVTELKEQCQLEQKAKAHLESALRNDIDEKQFKIDSLITKIDLLQKAEEGNSENLTKNLADSKLEIGKLIEKVQELRANAIVNQTKEHDYKMRIQSLENELSSLSEKEKENNLKLAQNKMDLHNELLSKDNENSRLKEEHENLKKQFDTFRGENLQVQNKNLIEKLEISTKKCNDYEHQLLKIEQLRVELQSSNDLNSQLRLKVKELEGEIENVKDEAKGSLLSLEFKIREKLTKEFEEREIVIENNLITKLRQVTPLLNNTDELYSYLVDKEKLTKCLEEERTYLSNELNTISDKYRNLESSHLDLIAESSSLRNKISIMEKELTELQCKNQQSDLKITDFTNQIVLLREEIDNYKEREVNIAEQLENEHKINRLEESNKELTDKLLLKETDLEEKIFTHTQLKTAIEDCISLFETRNREFVLKFEEIVHEIEGKQQKLITKIKNSDSALKTLGLFIQTRIYTLEQDLENSLAENRRLGEIITENEKETNSLKHSISELTREKEIVLGEMEKLVNERGILNEKIATLHSLQIEDDTEKNKVITLEKVRIKLENDVKDLEASFPLKGLEQLQEHITKFETKLVPLEDKIIILENELKFKGDEMVGLKADLVKNASIVIENNRLVDENQSLKQVLQEFTNTLKIKENELITLEEKLSLEMKKMDKLSADSEILLRCENELNLQIKNQQDYLNQKEKQVTAVLQNIEKYTNLIFDRNNGLIKFLSKFSYSDVLKNVEECNYNVRDAEQLIQSFLQTYVIEQENTPKLFNCLQEIELQYTTALQENSELTRTNNELRKSIDTDMKNQNEELETRIIPNTKLMAGNNISQDTVNLIDRIEEPTPLKDDTTIEKNGASKFEQRIKVLEEEKLSLVKNIEELRHKIVESDDFIKKEAFLTKEIENLEVKVVQYKSLNLSNQNSIEFYENELQRLKNQNEKINRKLDETLVTLHHCTELSSSTEIEYLKNVLYNYMLGKESLILAKVIATVCKFDPEQTKVILAKEQQKQTLFGQLGIL